MKRNVIVPARSGSKRIKNKNIRDFCGKSMISFVLDTIRNCGLFDVIHVSTDSSHICEKVEELGFPVDFLRPAELADDYTPIMPVLKYVLLEYKKRGMEFDQVWMIPPTSPFLESQDLLDADVLIKETPGHIQLMAVSEYQAPVEWAFKRNTDGSLVPVQAGMFSTRSQDLEAKYFDVGSLCVFPVQNVLDSEGAGSDTGFIGLVLPKYKAIDIDTLDDWELAEALYRGLYMHQES